MTRTLMKILGKDRKEILEIKITVTEMKNIIDGLTINSRLDITEENISQLEYISVGSLETNKRTSKSKGKMTEGNIKGNIQKLKQLQKLYHIREYQKKERDKPSQGSSENVKQSN